MRWRGRGIGPVWCHDWVVPLPNGMDVPAFVKWLQRKDAHGRKVFVGIGPFHPMVFARELILYGFFPTLGSLSQLGKGHGSHKLLVELGIQGDAFGAMRAEFTSAAMDAWKLHVEAHPQDVEYHEAILTLFHRTPTD